MELKRVLMVFALVAMCVGGIFSAATDSGSSSSGSSTVLQITGYSTVPEKVYPGTSGYAQLTVQNTGTDTATGITVYYNYLDSTLPSSLSAGDISAGSSSQVSVPFKVPQQVSTGLYAVNVDVYYTTLTSSQAKKTSVSIPLIVSQYEALEVTTHSTGGKVVAPGESIQLDLEVTNKGGVVNNLIISTLQNSSFSLEGTTEKSVGSIVSDSSKNVTLSLTASSTATVGKYTVPLLFTYQDALGTVTTQTLYIGPVSILEPSSQYRLLMDPLTPTEIGSQAVFALTIENTGNSALVAVVDLNSTSAFTPLGVTKVYFDTIGPGQSVSKNVSIGISSSISAGYYTLPIAITLDSGKSASQTVGIPVTATPNVTINADVQEGKVVVQISNTGNVAIRSVYANAESKDVALTGTTDKFIGTLNVDDFATFTLTTGAQKSAGAGTQAVMGAGKRAIQVTVSFKDSNNQVHTVKKDVDLQAYDASTTASTGSMPFGQAGAARTGRVAQGAIFGINPLFLGVGAVILAVVAYFVYKRFKKNKEKNVVKK